MPGPALTGAGALASQSGDLDDGAASIAAGGALYRQLGDHLLLGVTLGLLGNVAMAAGDLPRAQGFFEEEFLEYRLAGHAVAAGVATLNLGRVAAGRGDYAQAEVLFEEARAQVMSGGSGWDFAVATYWLGRVASARGDHARALLRYQEALAIVRNLAGEPVAVLCIEGIAWVIARASPDPAARILGAATAWRERMGRPTGQEDGWPIAKAEAGIRAALGDEQLAVSIARGRSLPLDAAIAEGLSAALTGGMSADANDPAVAPGLTRREREVLRLLAEGQSDRQIAAALFISPKTVGLHVSHLLAKLDVPSRAAAVAYAHRHRLVETLTPAPPAI